MVLSLNLIQFIYRCLFIKRHLFNCALCTALGAHWAHCTVSDRISHRTARLRFRAVIAYRYDFFFTSRFSSSSSSSRPPSPPPSPPSHSSSALCCCFHCISDKYTKQVHRHLADSTQFASSPVDCLHACAHSLYTMGCVVANANDEKNENADLDAI